MALQYREEKDHLLLGYAGSILEYIHLSGSSSLTKLNAPSLE